MNPLFAAALELQHFFEARQWRCCFIGGLAVPALGRTPADTGRRLHAADRLGEEARYVAELPVTRRHLVLLRPLVVSRASEPLPTPLGTLDAIHLATALIWRERMGASPTIATHESALGLAARSFGFDVRGV